MKHGMRSWLPLLAALLLALPAARAQEEALTRNVSLTVQDATLGHIASLLSEQADVPIVAQPSVAETLVSMNLRGVTLRTALEMLGEAAGVSVGLVGEQFILRNRFEAVAGGFRPLGTIAPKLRRDHVRKLVYHTQHLQPTDLAAIFGRGGVHRSGPGGGLEAAPPTSYSFVRAPLFAPADLSGAERALVARMEAEEHERFTRRWAELGGGGAAHPGCRGALALPEGINAVIGYNPGGELVVVGEPDSIAPMNTLIRELDTAPREFTLQATATLLPAAAYTRLAQGWETATSAFDNATMRYRMGTPAELATAITAAGGAPVALAPLELAAAKPAVLALTRLITPELRELEGCATTPLIASQVASALVATDLKIAAWPVAANPAQGYRVQLEPVFGDALLGLRDSSAGLIAKSSALPCTATTLTVGPGRAVALAGIAPSAGTNQTEACGLLASLPLSGDFYRGPGEPAADQVVVLTLQIVPATP
ncbi:MAG TPA: hypothetical protein DCZ72_04105 [Armatimonadetes bacterium]|nr:hypothetical protein [Armatimonadota bacterium]